MRTHLVVVLPPVFDHSLGLLQCVKDFTVEQFIAQLAIEAFAIAILPRASWLDVSGLGSDGSNPLSKSDGDKLRAVIGTNVCGNAARYEQIAERLDHIGCLQFPRDTYRQALSTELVDDAQHPECLSIMGTVRDEVIGPDMVGALRA